MVQIEGGMDLLPRAFEPFARGDGAEIRVGMATAVIGGVIVSTILTLVVVPVIYTWMDRFTIKHRSAATVDHYTPKAGD